MPRVNVIVAACNSQATLEETLASVHRQTYRDWRVYVVDDASDDATSEIASSSLADRGEVLRNPERAGPAAARNRAAAAGSGELIAALDSDDLWEPDYLERQIASLEAGRQTSARFAMACCDAHLLGPDGRLDRRWSDLVPLGDAVTLTGLLRDNPVYNSVLMRREAFEDVGGYAPDRELIGVEDYDLWVRLAERGWEFAVTREPVAVYRMRADSLSTNLASQYRGIRRVLERALERGALDQRQRAVARRQARLYALLETRASQGENAGGLANLAMLASTLRVAAEHPERWLGWLRHGARGPTTGRTLIR